MTHHGPPERGNRRRPPTDSITQIANRSAHNNSDLAEKSQQISATPCDNSSDPAIARGELGAAFRRIAGSGTFQTPPLIELSRSYDWVTFGTTCPLCAAEIEVSGTPYDDDYTKKAVTRPCPRCAAPLLVELPPELYRSTIVNVQLARHAPSGSSLKGSPPERGQTSRLKRI